MRKLPLVTLGLAASLTLGACATPKVPPRSTAPAVTATAPEPTKTQENPAPAPEEPKNIIVESAPPIVVTLLDAGEEPRAPLRIKPQLDQVFSVTQRTQSSVSTVIDGKQVAQATMPEVVQTMIYKTIHIDGEQVTYAWTATLQAKGGPNVNPAALAKMQEQLANAKGIQGKSVFDLRGVLIENRVETQSPDMMAALSHAWSPFPVEPVGAGASWRTEQTRKVNGFDATETTVYAIENIENGVITTSADANTQGEPGPFHHPDLPPGATINLKSLNGSSSKNTKLHNLNFFQTQSTQNAQLTTVLDMENNGKSQQIVTETTLKISSETIPVVAAR